MGGWAVSQLWLFWVAPILGAAIAGVLFNWLGAEEPDPVAVVTVLDEQVIETA